MDADFNPDKFFDGAGGLIGSLATSTITGLVNNALSQSNAEDQRNWQESMMDKSNQYNSPEAIAMRMRKAGLNPYVNMGQIPAASFGTGATAQTVPFRDPLELMNAFAQNRNISALTNVEISKEELLMKQISIADIAYQKGLIGKEDYDKRVKAYWEAYDSLGLNPTSLDIDRTKSEIKANNASADESTAQASYYGDLSDTAIAQGKWYDAQTETENYLREAKKDLLEAQGDSEKQRKMEIYRKAELMRIQALCEVNNEKRSQALFPYTKEAYVLEHQIKRYARDMAASDAELHKIETYIESLWNNSKDGQYTWDDVLSMVLDFIHSNVRLAGTAGTSTSSSKISSSSTSHNISYSTVNHL